MSRRVSDTGYRLRADTHEALGQLPKTAVTLSRWIAEKSAATLDSWLCTGTMGYLRQMNVREVQLGTVQLTLADGDHSNQLVEEELDQDAYRIADLNFAPEDIIVDVGGHAGIFALYMSTRHPGVVVHSFEPFPANIRLFERNLLLNSGHNVYLHKMGISADGRDLVMSTDARNSGGASCFAKSLHYQKSTNIPSITLDEAFALYKIDRCKLLKMDCEGSEHEILQATDVWGRVEHLRAEFHINGELQRRGFSLSKISDLCRQKLGAEKVRIQYCHMSE